ncbi:hypothetical protein [Gimesia sp.]|uniref:hypothetical protein n=1 Tax=Gimesia sp. TaxID=2024833 RepID=UPI000C6ACF0C|nr:hypothetical protein [Gimesia sp.]MAX37060.1 hypothetical protein [Gimesia sp.]HAH46799.1 hypothetical protein [Planctomycetaceae bacterium]HBL43528.1 hypothetical protein [Planctomycetaceae bacterium]
MQTVTYFSQRQFNTGTADRFYRCAIFCLMLVTVCVAAGFSNTAQAAEKNSDPNIIYILADDKN